MTHVCHYCEKEGAEYTCPECDEWTCEDCFTPMTQWNAGDALPCLGCSNESERQRSEEFNTSGATWFRWGNSIVGMRAGMAPPTGRPIDANNNAHYAEPARMAA